VVRLVEILLEAWNTLLANPIWPLSAISVGLIVGYFLKGIYIEKATLIFFIIVIAAFSIGRLIAVLFLEFPYQATGSGILGTIMFLIYFVAVLLGRRINVDR
jgi:hypothetical protein